MTRNQILVGCLWVTAASLVMAQDASPVPATPAVAPAVPVAMRAPAALPDPALVPDPPDPPMASPAAAPTPAAAPEPKEKEKDAKEAKEPKEAKAPKAIVVNGNEVYNLEDWGQYVDLSNLKIDSKAIADQVKAATKMSIDGQLGQKIREAVKDGQWENLTEFSGELRDEVLAAQKAYRDDGRLYAQQAAPPAPPAPIFVPGPARGVGGGVGVGQGFGGPQRVMVGGRGPNSDDRVFDRGETNLDSHNLDNALVNFNEVISRGGSRADGAVYYKAFTLNKMGRRDEAQSAINELRKTYSNSKWLEDAKALEVDVKSGKASSDEDDIKILALDGLMQNDPERAFPILEGLIKGAHVPSLKKQAVFVLAKNNSPRAQTLLEQIARGSVGDPDQQLMALKYVTDTKSNPARGQLLMEVYSSAGNDTAVRSVVINSFMRSKDYDHLTQIAKVEKNTELRGEAIRQLGEIDGQPELWAMFASETTPEGKRAMLNYMYTNGNTDKIAEVARTDKDATVRKAAVQVLASYKAPNISTAMVAIYSSEQDPGVKKTIISTMADHHDAKSLIDIYRKEKDVEMRRTLMSNIIRIHSPEVNDFLLEILKP